MTEKVYDIIHSCGIRDCGVTEFSPSLLLPNSRKRHLVPENCRSVIVCLFPYYTGEYNIRNVSLYALSRDYHIILREYLDNICRKLLENFSEYSFVPFADSSPVNEVLAAAKAGLGIVGLNRTLINPKYGSFVFVGEILTDLPVDTKDRDVYQCEKCKKCITACPSGALSETCIDTQLCISEISQKKGDLSERELEIFSKSHLVWGCDECQNACPHNFNIEKTYIPEFHIDCRPVVTEENFRVAFDERAYAWRGENVIRRNLILKSFKE